MKRFREPSLRCKIVDGDYHILYNNYVYKWNSPKYKYICYMKDDTFDCSIVDSTLIITDIRNDQTVLAQPLQLVE
jgi:hypothetical protein